MTILITVLMDLPAEHAYHQATLSAVRHAAKVADVEAEPVVCRTSAWDGQPASLGDGVIVGPGSPYEDEDAVYAAIRLARENGIPLVGT